jgi:ElaB/YqjD/DUF883 family membrane-anchored ribosome-binding protein
MPAPKKQFSGGPMKQENAVPQGQNAHETPIPFAKKAAEFREKATAVGHDLQDLKNITKELTADALHVITENASGYYDQGIKKAKTLEENLERNIQKNPVRYLLIAAGVGLVAGAVLLRRKKKEG